jgi:outer membrane protein assembly factor BamB
MKEKQAIVIICMLLFATFSSVAASMNTNENESNPQMTVTTDWWPMFHHDAARTGFSTSSAPTTTNVKWVATAGTGRSASPVIVNNMVYVYGRDNNIHCLYAINGTQKWQHPISTSCASPAVADGKVYIANQGSFDCLDASDGHLLWSTQVYSSYASSSPAVRYGKIYAVTQDNKVYCLNTATGSTIWTSVKMGSSITWTSCPAVADGKVYVGSYDHKLYCFNANATGSSVSPLWTYTLGGPIYNSPAVSNGKVYVGNSGGGSLFCMNGVSGSLNWSFFSGLYSWVSTPAIAYGNVYFGAGNILFCLNAASGVPLWNCTLPSGFDAPAIADNKIYVGAGNVLYCLNVQTGAPLWSYDFSLNVGSPAIVDGNLYAVTSAETNNVFCFGSSSNHLPTAPTMSGPNEGIVNLTYTFTIGGTTDSDGDAVKYGIDWDGNGVIDEWTGFYNISLDIFVSHTWNWKGTYPIKVRAQDSNLAQSELSSPHIIIIGNHPPLPPTIDGPTEGIVGRSYTFTAVTTDPDGHQVKYGWDWNGDNYVDEWTDFYDSGVPIQASRTWNIKGLQTIKIKAADSWDEGNWSANHTITISNHPPLTPAVSGPSEGIIGIGYNFTVVTTDPDNHQIMYWWDWDNGNPQQPTSFYDSGVPMQMNHIFDTIGVYHIKVKANDSWDESGWVIHTIMITTPANLSIGNITGGWAGFLKGGKVTAEIKNTGGANATNVKWNITLTGGPSGAIILKGAHASGVISTLKGTEPVLDKPVIGWGDVTIIVTARADGIPEITKTAEGFIFIIFVKIK